MALPLVESSNHPFTRESAQARLADYFGNNPHTGQVTRTSYKGHFCDSHSLEFYAFEVFVTDNPVTGWFGAEVTPEQIVVTPNRYLYQTALSGFTKLD